MKTALIAALCLVTLPIAAHPQSVDLRGQWQVRDPKQPSYVGVVLVDAERRATWDAPLDYGRPAKLHGYVAGLDAGAVEFIFTDREAVTRTRCTIQSSDLLHCRILFRDGAVTNTFALTRVGPGPVKIMPASR